MPAKKLACFIVCSVIEVPVIAKNKADAIKLIKERHKLGEFGNCELTVRADATGIPSTSKEFAKLVGKAVDATASSGKNPLTSRESVATDLGFNLDSAADSQLQLIFSKGKDPNRHPGFSLPEATPRAES